MEAGEGMNSQLPSHFYETITLRPEHPIRISTLFMMRHGASLGDSVYLRDSGPGVTEFKVELKNINGGTWLDKGWEEFVRFYSIKEDYLLMFSYQGNSRFLVIICDKTANQIPYPVDPHHQIRPVKSEPEEDSPPSKGKQILEVPSTVVNGRRLPKRSAGQTPGGSCARNRRIHPNSTEREDLRACERDFKSENPYFATKIKAINLNKHHKLVHIPFGFWRSNFAANISGMQGLNFKLNLPDEETEWPVVVERYKKHGTADHGRIHGNGWTQFAKATKLTVGDRCIFELLEKDNTFIVHRLK